MAGEVNGPQLARVVPGGARAVPLAARADGSSPDAAAPPSPGAARVIGDIIQQLCKLSDAQVRAIVEHQRARGVRFGEAAVELELVTPSDVTWALAQQFHYPYQKDGSADCEPELVVARDPFGDVAEAMRDLRSRLLMGVLAPAQPRAALAVVSTGVGDGKSFVAANLAVAFSQLGARTLLIDGDMRTPRQHQLFRLTAPLGLSSVLVGRAGAQVVQQVQELPHLHVLTVGTPPPNPVELLHRSSLPALMHDLLARFDHVVVDTPAASQGADGRVLAAACGAALVVARRHRTRTRDLESLLAALSRSPVRMAGVLSNEY
jgi:receptor protein-tyrosine kinase